MRARFRSSTRCTKTFRSRPRFCWRGCDCGRTARSGRGDLSAAFEKYRTNRGSCRLSCGARSGWPSTWRSRRTLRKSAAALRRARTAVRGRHVQRAAKVGVAVHCGKTRERKLLDGFRERDQVIRAVRSVAAGVSGAACALLSRARSDGRQSGTRSREFRRGEPVSRRAHRAGAIHYRSVSTEVTMTLGNPGNRMPRDSDSSYHRFSAFTSTPPWPTSTDP